jgi:hypothetical protein
LGFLLVILAAILSPSRDATVVPIPLAAFVFWVICGLLCEVVALCFDMRRKPALGATGSAPQLRRGGGRIAPVEGVQRKPNKARPSFGRFVRFSSQPDHASETRASSSPASSFTGRVVLVSFFLGKRGKRWDDQEVSRVLASLDRASSWMEKEAARWSADLAIALADTYFEAADATDRDVEIEVVTETYQMGLFEAHSVEKTLASVTRASATLGFEGVADWLDRTGARVDADHVVWLIHPREAGRSHAMPQERSLLEGARVAICYGQEADFPAPAKGPVSGDSVTIAHEILHLFGATDKYDTGLDTFPRGTVSPQDIMRLEQESLARLRVDQLSATELGWCETHS